MGTVERVGDEEERVTASNGLKAQYKQNVAVKIYSYWFGVI